jgi:hypothetical protein
MKYKIIICCLAVITLLGCQNPNDIKTQRLEDITTKAPKLESQVYMIILRSNSDSLIIKEEKEYSYNFTASPSHSSIEMINDTARFSCSDTLTNFISNTPNESYEISKITSNFTKIPFIEGMFPNMAQTGSIIVYVKNLKTLQTSEYALAYKSSTKTGDKSFRFVYDKYLPGVSGLSWYIEAELNLSFAYAPK